MRLEEALEKLEKQKGSEVNSDDSGDDSNDGTGNTDDTNNNTTDETNTTIPDTQQPEQKPLTNDESTNGTSVADECDWT